MIWTIVNKEIHSNLITFRFVAGILICLVLIGFSARVLTQDYRNRLKDYQLSLEEAEEELKNWFTYSQINPLILKKPEPLSIFSLGFENSIGNRLRVPIGRIPTLEYLDVATGGNPFIAYFATIDLILIIIVVGSLLGILFSYDAVSGERERGTLRLMLASEVSRAGLLWGKFLGGMFSLAIPLILGFICGLLTIFIYSNGMVNFDGESWIRIGVLFLISLIYIALFFLIGLLLSTLTKRSTTTLIVALLVWVLIVFVWPELSRDVATKVLSVPPKGRFEARVAELNKKFNDEFNQYYEKHLISEGEDRGFIINIRANWLPQQVPLNIDRANIYVETTHEPTLKQMAKIIKFIEPLRLNYANLVYYLEQKRFKELKRQATLATNMARISPAFLFRETADATAGTGLQSFQKFIHSARIYRGQVLNFLKSKDAFNQPEYFTSQFLPKNQSLALNKRLPRFTTFANLTLTESFKTVSVRLGVMIISGVILFFLSFLAFVKYDVR